MGGLLGSGSAKARALLSKFGLYTRPAVANDDGGGSVNIDKKK